MLVIPRLFIWRIVAGSQHKTTQKRSVVQVYVARYATLCCIMPMKRLFDPDAIRAQIGNLVADRARIDSAIASLEDALQSIEKLESPQGELPLEPGRTETTLQDAVRGVCMAMADGITRQRVITALERNYPGLRPKSASVAAALANLTKGDQPILKVAVEGKGRSPSFFTTEGNSMLQLSSDEIAALVDESATHGTGGWQSLWIAMLKKFDKAKGTLVLTPELRARIFHYYHTYGVGGWQNKIKRLLRRHLPHMFVP